MEKRKAVIFLGASLFLGVGLLLAQERPRGPGGRFGPAGERGSSMSKPPLAQGEAEKKILAVLDELGAGDGRGMMNVPVEDGRLLRLLAETIGAKQIVEIGTSNGYSGIWQCLALKTTGGKLTTFEIDAQRAALRVRISRRPAWTTS